ncbi:hypothetical protein WJX74_010850 [Apatococcus lobatus]|uniref:B9 domain-containing protein 2 n=1 Tax=Apatococcus lobatus TaxID=904363 RepID=A0AAW1QL22_9CHLO
MAELHVIGELTGASGFRRQSIFCKWYFAAGQAWELLEGQEGGQTQTDQPAKGSQSVWGHPIDAHFLCKGLTGWPKLHLEVWKQDKQGRCDICGYGFVHIPTAPGSYELECATWRPEGSRKEQWAAWCCGGNPQLVMEEVVHGPEDRYRLQTVPGGTVQLRLGIIMKDFGLHHVQTGSSLP